MRVRFWNDIYFHVIREKVIWKEEDGKKILMQLVEKFSTYFRSFPVASFLIVT